MGILQPYHRICRPFLIGNNYFHHQSFENITVSYFFGPKWATDRIDLLRAFALLEKDLLNLFDYIEPADENLATHSMQLHALLLRACNEFEANAKAILRANNYLRAVQDKTNITDYHKIESSSRLSEYTIKLPIWKGRFSTFSPFQNWKHNHSLTWYQSYNNVKHNRSINFLNANLENTLLAIGGVFVILFSQFHIFAFDPYHTVSSYDEDDGLLSHPNSIFHISLPKSWTNDEKYNFDWGEFRYKQEPYANFPFNP
ncbi:hypothetical protein [Geothrix paludis]|uniref:hypothetical protein n=1 Tax=Geothrix paludis TaxID=2922722 RepID=UPI001FAC104F|nr:hypothetical protein [Geothrix paludis]